MKSEIKHILFAVFVIAFSCTKEQNNPYDRECPPEIWSPTGLTASQGTNGVTLAWEQQSTHFDGFLVERSTDSVTWVTVNTALIDKSKKSYVDSGNLPGGKMYYRVSAKADKNQSNYSYAKAICFVPLTPGTITGKTTVVLNETGVWYSIAPVNGATSYNWTIPEGATIVSGQGTVSIKVNFGSTCGNIGVCSVNNCRSSDFTYQPICVLDFLIDPRDGKTYKYVLIGNQVWMAENLAWLPSVSPPGAESITAPVYYVYDYSGTDVIDARKNLNFSTYGVLYNWPAAMKACPSGWHLPSDTEWTTLENYLIANGYNYDGTTSGSKIAKSMATATGWDFRSETGDVGNTDYPAYRNKSCFSLLPGGQRIHGGIITGAGGSGYWWSSSEYPENGTHGAWFRTLATDSPGVLRGINFIGAGLSVRCLRD